MAINVEVVRGKVESNASVLKRFTRRVQESGVVSRMKGERWLEREKSRNHRRTKKLGSLVRTAAREKLIKLGKIKVTPRRGAPRQ
jgi:ribosomal protein S21